jgi:hypothetical protein
MHATIVDRFADVDVHTIDGGHDRLLCALTGDVVDITMWRPIRMSAQASD